MNRYAFTTNWWYLQLFYRELSLDYWRPSCLYTWKALEMPRNLLGPKVALDPWLRMSEYTSPAPLPFGGQCWGMTYTPVFPFGGHAHSFIHKSLSQCLLLGNLTQDIILFFTDLPRHSCPISSAHTCISLFGGSPFCIHMSVYVPLRQKLYYVNYNRFVRILHIWENTFSHFFLLKCFG